MSFGGGGQSNATPWQRNVMPAHPQTGNFHQAPPHLFMQSTQQSNMAAFGGHSGGLQANIFSNAGQRNVSFPQPVRSGLNPVAFQQAAVGAVGGGGGGGPGGVGGGGNGSGNGGLSQQHYNAIGTVTKINNDCGLVNDEVFFYRNVCKGIEPKLGDRVVFEATYASTGQFKWNATRIQLMQQPQPLLSSSKAHVGYNANQSDGNYQRAPPMHRHNSPKRSPLRGGGGGGILSDRHDRDRRNRDRDRVRRSRERDEDEIERKRRRDERERSRERERDRDRAAGKSMGGTGGGGGGSISNLDSTRSGGNVGRNDRDRERNNDGGRRDRETDREREERDRAREKDLQLARTANKSRRARPIRRYMFQIPKFRLTYKTADVQELRRRYSTMYIPSDFFYAKMSWSDIFTPENAFSLQRPCQFHIMHKLVQSPPLLLKDGKKSEKEATAAAAAASVDPPDANYMYSAKVMLLSLPTMAELYEKCFEQDDDVNGYSEGTHPSRLINFLVGIRGRNEPMAIGGPWSPSLDGEHPDKDPSVLIRTAIRTCRTLTGIDLSDCTQWYRFLELYYHRGDSKSSDKHGASSRVETVVIFLPDVHSCLPSIERWTHLTQVYKRAGENALVRKPPSSASTKSKQSTTAEETTAASPSKAAASETTHESPNKDNDGAPKSPPASSTLSDTSQVIVVDSVDEDMDTGGHSANADEKDTSAETKIPTPTHYSLLDVKSMKVQEIRDELTARELSDKGVRAILVSRLTKSLNNEKAQEAKLKSEVATEAEDQSNQSKAKNDSDTANNKTDDKSNAKVVEEGKGGNNTDAGDGAQSKADDGKSPDKKPNGNAEGEDSEEWSGLIDFEMSDIVILDEYDSNMNVEENAATAPKELDEKEKSQIVRRYTLPSQPHIIVHPNKNAKGGKFNCAVMSLSVLLDYHLEDTKERFFEVSFFAELFNEMLMRDFGFNIYKEIYLHKGNAAAEGTDKQKKEASGATVIKDESGDKNEDKTKTNSSKDNGNGASTDNAHKDHDDDSQSQKSDARRTKNSTGNAHGSGNDKDNREDRSVSKDCKMTVVKPDLLLSFIYFDVSYCGYIFEKDLEDLFLLLGLNLSRSQVKKYLSKLSSRQAIYYRKLTDKEESPSDNINSIKNEVEQLEEEELKRIATGNWAYEKIYKGLSSKIETDNEKAEVLDSSNTGLVNYKGTVIDVGKLLEQMKRVEKNYSNLDKMHMDLQKKHGELSRDHNKSNNRIKDLQGEVKSLSRKLSDTNQELATINRKHNDQQNTLTYIYNRVAPFFIREKDKTDNGATSKDRDAEKKKDSARSKDKDKEKEKDKEKSKDAENSAEKTGGTTDKESSASGTQQTHSKQNPGTKIAAKAENSENDEDALKNAAEGASVTVGDTKTTTNDD